MLDSGLNCNMLGSLIESVIAQSKVLYYALNTLVVIEYYYQQSQFLRYLDPSSGSL